MYEYFPREPKRTEKLMLIGVLVTALIFLGISKIPEMPFPALPQFLVVVLLTWCVLILTRYLLRNFSYRIAPSENNDIPELTITEYCGKRVSVVCRVLLSDVVEVRCLTHKEYRRLARTQRERCFYDYTSRVKPVGLYLLTIREGAELCDVRIEADEILVKYLTHQ